MPPLSSSTTTTTTTACFSPSTSTSSSSWLPESPSERNLSHRHQSAYILNNQHPSTCCEHSHSSASMMMMMDEGITTVEVTAPATLGEGYTFWASDDRTSFPVIVPFGGVQKGQMMRTAVCEQSRILHTGKWKDGIFACFPLSSAFGAWFCPQLLLQKILTSMKMNWLISVPDKKRSNNDSQQQRMVKRLMIFMVCISIYDYLPSIQSESQDSSDDEDTVSAFCVCCQMMYLLLSVSLSLYGLYVVVKLRRAIRLKYGIPAGKLGACEDMVLACFCNCCTLAQMARQTTEQVDDDHPQKPLIDC